MKAKEIINMLECEVRDLMERFDNAKNREERQECGLLADHIVTLLHQIKGTGYDEEYAYLWKKYNLTKEA